MRNALELDYPHELLEIIVASDGSSDRTNEIVSAIPDARVKLHAFAERSGKTACLNRVVPATKGDIVVFTDANSMLPPDNLRKLVPNFADDAVGSVTGWTRYVSSKGGKDTTGLYAKLEKWIKTQESYISSCVGADGAIFAVRKHLYHMLEDRDINDFIIPLNVIAQKKRVILDSQAFCYEESAESSDKAFRRQVRITNRTLSAIFRRIYFVNFLKFGSFSFFLISHKIIRLLVPFFLLGALIIDGFLLDSSFFHMAAFISMIVFVLMGAVGWSGIKNGRIFSICGLFLLTFSAQFVGCMRFLIGLEDKIWRPER